MLDYLSTSIRRFWFESEIVGRLRAAQIFWALGILEIVLFVCLPYFSLTLASEAPLRNYGVFESLSFWNIFRYWTSSTAIIAGLAVLTLSLLIICWGRYYRPTIFLSCFLFLCLREVAPFAFSGPFQGYLGYVGICLLFAPDPRLAPMSSRGVWVLRFIQLQFSAICLIDAFKKSSATVWLSGEASLLALQKIAWTNELTRYLVDHFSFTPNFFKCLTWFILWAEIFLAIGFWVPQLRRYAIGLGVFLFFIFCLFFRFGTAHIGLLIVLGAFTDWRSISGRKT